MITRMEGNINDDMNPFNALLDESSNDPNVLKRRIKILEDKIENFKLGNSEIREEVRQLRFDQDMMYEAMGRMARDLDSLNQYGRRENIEISGIPNTVPDRDLESVVGVFVKSW